MRRAWVRSLSAAAAVLAATAVVTEAMRRTTGAARVGALGISEGGWVVSAAAARADTPLSFVVLASAPVVSPLERSSWITERALRGAPEPVRRAAATLVASWLHMATAWMGSPSGPSLTGSEPTSAAGVAIPPDISPLTDARMHLALSAAMATIAGLSVWRRSKSQEGEAK